MSEKNTINTARRRRFTPVALATGAVGAVLLSLSLTGTLSGFIASITNTTNTAATGSLVMQETGPDGTTVCTSTTGGSLSVNKANCATINKFGGRNDMVPGATVNTKVVIKNIGTITAKTFALKPGTCSQTTPSANTGSATDLCAKMKVDINAKTGSTTTPVFTGTAASLAASANPISLPAPVAADGEVEFTFTVTLDSAADASYQALEASMPLEWIFTS